MQQYGKMLRKVMITPYFGKLPSWFTKYQKPRGYDCLFTQDLDDFKQRVKKKLGIECPIKEGTGKLWDFRPALGLLYEKEIKDYDFWGHTDFDCVYGNVGKWVTDEFLNELDIHSNHNTYMCGCWSLYRNTPEVNNLFFKSPVWEEKMLDPEPNGWVEEEFSRLVEQSGLRYKYTFWQGNPYDEVPNLYKNGSGQLFQDQKEIMMFHFRRSKVWPL